MDVAKLAKSTSMAETGNKMEVAAAVQKRAQEIQTATATQMLEAIKAPSSANLPAHLGTKVNTTA